MLPSVKETELQKQRIDKIIDNCKKVQEKEAIRSQTLKQSARNYNEGFNNDYNKL